MPNVVPTPAGVVTFCLGALLALVLTCLLAAPSAAHGPPALALEPGERALCKLINRFRAQGGAPPLRASLTLTKAARWHSLDMARYDYFGHVDSRGREFDSRIRSFGYTGATMGENLAAGAGDAGTMFEALRSSPRHRRNMLRTKLKVIGVGRTYGAGTAFEWYWTTTFGGTLDRTHAC
jgi:uncharacterized protein YkwD